jgi:hypothetical protein
MPEEADQTRPGLAPDYVIGQSAYSEALAAEILEAVAVSPRSVGWLVRANPHWPSLATIHNWKHAYPEFRNAFAAARRMLADELAFETIEIADDSDGDVKLIPRRDGSTYAMLDQEFVGRSKLKTEVRRWLAGKLAPEVYGERIDGTLRVGPILSQEEALDLLR